MKKHTKYLIIFIKIAIPLTILFFIIGICTVFFYLSKIPNVSKINEEGYEMVSRLYTKDGKHISDYYKTTRHYIPLEELPPHVINAFLAAEDANFYHNMGIDVKGIFRASLQNVKYAIFGGSGYQGASTITQQLVKNVLLTNERTLDRKIKEILLSIIITKELSKQKILELYLNYIFFGSNAYGIQSAAQEYFNKNAKDLSIQEAATLAAMPKAPSVINPRINYERTLARRNWIIDQMLLNNFIEKETAMVARKSDIEYVKNRSFFRKTNGGYNAIAQHIETVEMKKLKIENLYTHGYFIKTTIDSQIQDIAFTSSQKRLDEYQKRYGLPTNQVTFTRANWCEELKQISEKYQRLNFGVAFSYKNKYSVTIGILNGEKCKKIQTIALEHVPLEMGIVTIEKQEYEEIQKLKLPKSVEKMFAKNPMLALPVPQPNVAVVAMNLKNGKILAMIGDYFDTPNGFNRATQAYRQVGSTIKPFVYETALENGFTPASKFMDAPLTIGENWKPENSTHDYLGAITLRRALERSRNIPTVRIADSLNISTLKNNFIKFGLIGEKDNFDLSSALGSTATTPLKLMEAYSVFANGGKKIEPTFIEYVANRSGEVVFQNSVSKCEKCNEKNALLEVVYQPSSKDLISPQSVFQIHSILEGVFLRGTAAHTSSWVGPNMAGKTGTTNNAKDSWFVGYNSNIIIAVYIGFDDSRSLGANEYGATLALPIFVDVMQTAMKKYPSEKFKIPNGIQAILIDRESGKRVSEYGSGVISEYFKEGDALPEFEETNVDLYGY